MSKYETEKRRTVHSNECLRRRYRPTRVRFLFIGEAPPASGRFFYQADSGLYRAIREAFLEAFPHTRVSRFLDEFRALGCYLVDLCGRPVDQLGKRARNRACLESEPNLSRTLRRLRPKVVITVVRSIANNVKRSEGQANWSGLHVELPYPGRWHHHRRKFVRALVLLLRKMEGCTGQRRSSMKTRTPTTLR
jgi:hypothetical protein